MVFFVVEVALYSVGMAFFAVEEVFVVGEVFGVLDSVVVALFYFLISDFF